MNYETCLIMSEKKDSKYVAIVDENNEDQNVPDAVEKQYHSSQAAHLKPFVLKNEELRKKWIRARGRVKTSVKLNLSAKITSNKKHDLLIEEAGGHHHSKWAKYMIHPNNPWRKRWDLAIIFFVLYLCWKIPFNIGFEHWYGNKDLKPFEVMMDWWFIADIGLNFITGFVHDGHLVMDPKESAKHYFEFWFWIDTFASIPFDLIVKAAIPAPEGGGAAGAGQSKAFRKAIKMVKWAKIPKLFRLGRLVKQLKGNKKFLKVFMYMSTLIWLMHFIGCLWVFVIEPCPNTSDFICYKDVKAGLIDKTLGVKMTTKDFDYDQWYGYPDRSSPTFSDIQYKFAKCKWNMYPEESECNKVWSMYSTAVDWGAKSVLGSSPVFLDQDAWATDVGWETTGAVHTLGFIASAIGIILTSMVMGELFVILSHKDPEDWNYFGRLDRIKKEIINSHIPDELASDILQYYDYIYMNNRHGKCALLGDIDMPQSLKNRVAVSLHLDIIRKIDLFRQASPACLVQSCLYLKLEIHMPNVVVVSAAEQSVHVEEIKMYTINRGVLDVIKGAVKVKKKKAHGHGHGHGHVAPTDHHEKEEEDTILTQLFQGLSFGELSMLDPYRKRKNSVRTRTVCELYAMSITDFKLLVESFPNFAKIVRKIAHSKKIKYSLDHYNIGLGEEDDEAHMNQEVSLDDKLEHLDRQVKVICENVRRLTIQTS